MIDFHTLLAYSDNCRKLLRQTLEANPEVWERPIEPSLIEFKTIREIVCHMAGADERWIVMRIGGTPVEFYMNRAPRELEAVFADWERNRAHTKEFLNSRSETDLRAVYHIKLGDIWEGDLTVEQILFHILNHETHHRGQISMALQQFGVDPPDFDFVFMHG